MLFFFCNFAAQNKMIHMKARFSYILVLLTVCVTALADVHISVSNPATWRQEDLRPYINQTVIFDVPMVVTSNYNNLQISPRRFFSPTNQARPGSRAIETIASLNEAGGIYLYNAPKAEGDAYYRCGEKVYNLKAKVNSNLSLNWISGEWRGNTRQDLENADIRAMVNIDGCDECLLVCTMNLEYYLVENLGGQTGPKNLEAHNRQRAKISKALAKINADIYGLVEIEQGQKAVAEIATDLNSNIPGRNYTYIDDGGQAEKTYTKSAFVYDRNKVKPIGVIQEMKAGDIPAVRHRMICFEELATGERFIFSVNHFKAKGSGGLGYDSDERDNGQGGWNQRRQEEAQIVIDMYKNYHRNSAIKEKDILIMGDLNSYAKEDPIMQFVNEGGMIDLHRAFHADSSYSYTYRDKNFNYQQLAGYLDHALCNSTLRPQVMGACAFHINSDESDSYTYDKSGDQTMFRCSDHDPVLVGLHLDNSLTYDPTPTLNTEEGTNGQPSVMTITNAYKESQTSYYAIYDIYGRMVTQEKPLKIESDQHPVELPMQSGIYVLRLYYDHKVYPYKFIVR